MKICMVEVCEDEDVGSIGAYFVAHHVRSLGHTVDMLRDTADGYDIELISVHHSTDFERLARLKKRAKHRIIGGHVMQNNPRPAIPFADVICIGEGETWIKQAVTLLEKYDNVDCLKELKGTIISKYFIAGDPIPPMNQERPLPINPPYLNRQNRRDQSWYIEIARGCPYRCHYCELGHSSSYRRYQAEHIKSLIDQIDTKLSRRINFFAPDEASHPNYNEIFDYIYHVKGYSANYSSMRIESVLHNGLPETMKTNHLIRCGIDGLTYETRFKVRKPISHEMILDYFKKIIDRGHTQFKMFMIFGYEWEKLADFDEFVGLIDDITKIPNQRNIKLRIKWTPFIPQPKTPLADSVARYDSAMVNRIKKWHEIMNIPSRSRGFFISNDGLMGHHEWKKQCEDVKGDEFRFTKHYSQNILHLPK